MEKNYFLFFIACLTHLQCVACSPPQEETYEVPRSCPCFFCTGNASMLFPHRGSIPCEKTGYSLKKIKKASRKTETTQSQMHFRFEE